MHPVSGRPKGAPASPEEERAQLRQLARELHEAAQDARDAARELRTARAETEAGVHETVVSHTRATLDELSEAFRNSRKILQDFQKVVAVKTEEAVKDIEDNHAKLAGFKDSTEFARWLVKEVFESLVHDPHFTRDVGAAMQQLSPVSLPPQIQVGTREQLAAFIAAGGNPGLIIDAAE